MNNLIPEEWLPMEPQKGPPLPKSMQIYWPWYKPPEVPPEEVPPEEVPPEEFVPPEVPPEYHYLHIYIVGKGTVTPGSGTYRHNSTVTLTAIPSFGYVFDHWSGDLTGTRPMVNIIMNRNKSVTAYFKVAPPEVAPPEVPPGVADIRVENLTIEPVECYVGDWVTISIVARNYGGASGSKVITCDVNGKVSKQTVSLGAGVSQAVTFTATPQEAKTYQVSVNGLTGSFKVVPGDRFYMPATMEVTVTDGSILDMYWKCDFRCPITNNGVSQGTHKIVAKDNLGRGFEKVITLKPGETYVCRPTPDGPNYIDFRRISPPLVWEITGDWEGDNYSRGEARP